MDGIGATSDPFDGIVIDADAGPWPPLVVTDEDGQPIAVYPAVAADDDGWGLDRG